MNNYFISDNHSATTLASSSGNVPEGIAPRPSIIMLSISSADNLEPIELISGPATPVKSLP